VQLVQDICEPEQWHKKGNIWKPVLAVKAQMKNIDCSSDEYLILQWLITVTY
jgi:hypothetical protein